MHSVEIRSHKLLVPSTWNELTPGQLIYICRLFSVNMTVTEFKVSVLHKWLSVKKRLWHYLSAENVYYLSQCANFLLEEVNLTKALIKTIRLKRFPFTRFYGPADELSTSTFGEFTKAQVRYEQFSRTRDPEQLNELVAILFRRKRFFWWIIRHFSENSDPRVRLWDRTLPKRAKQIASLPYEVKYAVFLFISGVMASLPEKFPNVYRTKPSTTASAGNNWSTLIISLADGKTDDESLDRILNSNLYNVMLGLEHKSIEYFDFIKKYPDQ
jgi:hypothetical protein